MKEYYRLIKPGILFGNALTACGAFVMASTSFSLSLFLIMLIGLGCIISSACVFNNCFDKEADQKMVRTQSRALVMGTISIKQALLFACALLVLGVFYLSVYTPSLTLISALSGFIIYVGLYSPLKYKTPHATLIGSLAGATPPLVGYTAVTGILDRHSLLLFLMIALWQMPHFFAIALYRQQDYAKASIPILPLQKGAFRTKIEMLIYVAAFMLTSVLLSSRSLYRFPILFLGLAWLILALKGFRAKNDILWARQMFLFSLIIVTVFCVLICFL